MPTKNVNLTQHFSEFVDEMVESGAFKNASEVFRAGLRLLEQKTAEDSEKLNALRKLVAAGFAQIDQGQGIEFSDVQSLNEHIAKIGRRAAQGRRKGRRSE